jgi:EAL domain-containing protein (putative c-di-GMP-specific phosphodiesterase class I)
VRTALSASGLGPRLVHLEVVESRSLVDVPAVVERLTELRQLGVQISLDDFGTGYSTLACCSDFPWTRSRSTAPSSRGCPGCTLPAGVP